MSNITVPVSGRVSVYPAVLSMYHESVPFFGHAVLVSDSVHVSEMLPYLYLWGKKPAFIRLPQSQNNYLEIYLKTVLRYVRLEFSRDRPEYHVAPLYPAPPLHMTGVKDKTHPPMVGLYMYVYWVLSTGFSVPWIAVAWIYDWHCEVLTHHHHHHQLQHHLTRPWERISWPFVWLSIGMFLVRFLSF